MKLFFLIFFLFFPCNIIFAQESSLQWFIDKNDTFSAQTDTDIKSSIDPNVPFESDIQGLENSLGLHKEAHFANNNKDLFIALSWLKAEYKKDSYQNIVLSPLSLYFSSVLLANGVVDETLFEFSSLFSILHLSATNKNIKYYLKQKRNSLSIFTSLWGEAFSEYYQKQMKSLFDVEIWKVEGQTSSFNDWLNSKTSENLSIVLPLEQVSSQDLFLLNMTHFNSQLSNPFSSTDTSLQPFYNLGMQPKDVQMMKLVGNFDYYEDDQLQAVRLYYTSNDTLSLILPKQSVNFSSFIEDLNVHSLNFPFEKKNINLMVPKFDLEHISISTQDLYQQFGIKKIFESSNHDFAKMRSYDEPYRLKEPYLLTKFALEDTLSGETSINPEQEGAFHFIANRPFIFILNSGDIIGALTRL